MTSPLHASCQSSTWHHELRRACKLTVFSLVLVLGGACPLSACEPILPMFQVLGGASTLAQSFVVLLAAVAIKSALYAWFLRASSPGSAAVGMVAGNIVSTVVGGFAAACVAGMPLIGLIGITCCAVLPARRIAEAHPGINRYLSTTALVLIMTALVFGSLLLWGWSRSILHGHGSLLLYWSAKIAFVFVGLVCSLVITVFWEEWVIWRLSGSGLLTSPHLSSIIKANVITLGLVSIYAAAVILPRRLESPDFLVDLFARLTGLA